ncbi:SAM-dependent methyltransferase [Nonomuraea sp. NPDC050783]|uniref:SAM-dependent methyltransferase n=1 Tax=Nonomuraea sp. NPDC050783 TaxID=3154634 RepID=UPI003467795D
MTEKAGLERRAPAGIDTTRPTSAGIYNYVIGGEDHFPADREAAEAMLAGNPYTAVGMRATRAFLRRAVRWLADPRHGAVDQFLDIGSGFPTAGNVHEIAQSVDPDARVVYVDYDPTVVACARALTAGDDRVRVIEGDLRRVEDILDHPDVRGFLDWRRPVALVLNAVLHFVTDEQDPQRLIATVRDRMAPGSFLALSHGSMDGLDEILLPDQVRTAEEQYRRSADPLVLRTHDRIQRFFDGFVLVEPGLVHAPRWRPDGTDDDGGLPPEVSGVYGGVARLPARATGP